MEFDESDNVCPISILLLALIEARKYRWLKSLEQNKDAGDEAIEEWFKKHFKKWYRQQWIEHLTGSVYHQEFSSDEFDLISKEKEDKNLAQSIINFLIESGNNGENLGIMLWARNVCADIDKVTKFLEKIKINNKRFIWDHESLVILCKALEEADKYKWIESQKKGCDLGEKAIIEWFSGNWNLYLSKK